ncbi:30S ribosomal protein S1 [Rubripirellula lacrimiformis]|uniref:30S ribosomal protein S1 n=1 Tax=Rubripirellula lacrimiformis TaxID=1930273 RepID=A0A517NF59_9BACT|nr:S1 RNA-binding domain-containing protein [Rubripirellula lacrimiformis]QDT05767.1 30S ribosomal protein S1 [Rubripirellula lacrimiformis]
MTTGDHSAPETDPTAAGNAASTPSASESASAATQPTAETTPNPESDTAVTDAASGQPQASGAPESSAASTDSDSKTSGSQAKAARGAGPLSARGLGIAKPSSPTVSAEDLAKQTGVQPKPEGQPKKKKAPRPRLAGDKATADKPKEAGAYSTGSGDPDKTPRPKTPQRVAVPNRRMGLSDDLQAELDAELAAADVDAILGGSAGMPERKTPLEENARVSGQVLKVDKEFVFVALGGPDEGMVPFEQFTEEPAVGSSIEVVIRGFASADGLYVLGLPGGAIDVSDWEDIEEGAIVEATITGHNTGGLECKVGGARGFIPMGQISEHRIEDASEFVDQKFLCVVTEANARRGNLVLSRRAILEREREEKRKEQLESIEVGQVVEGIVRSVKDFGAFVDLGGLDGLIHISKLSWDRVAHPSEVVEVGQKVAVQIDKVDKETGKIGLSFRDLQENPWDTAEGEFEVGSIHTGSVTRIAAFGCFVKLTAGVEGLVHISEVANHRVSRVDAFVSEGQDVEVKVLSFDRDAQKIGLSMKQVNAPAVESSKPVEEEEEQRDVAVKPMHAGPLKGGNNTASGGEKFGLRW